MIIDKIENAHLYTNLHPGIAKALRYIQTGALNELSFGKHELEDDALYVIIKEYHTKPISEPYLESHRRYIDVQYIMEGVEQMGVAINNSQVPHKMYDSENDYLLFDTAYDVITVKKGMFAIFFPDDMHLPDITTGASSKVKKAVFKVKIQHS